MGDTPAPTPKVRSIDFLTPEQLQRKREVDRKSQRQARERTRAYISELEQKVLEFETRIQGLEHEFSAFVTRCTCKNGHKPSGIPTPEVSQWDVSAQDILATTNAAIDSSDAGKETWLDQGCGVNQEQWYSFSNGLGGIKLTCPAFWC